MTPPRAPLADPSADALMEAQRRAARGGLPRSVLILHLGSGEALQPHHVRVARAILSDVAQRLDGEVFRLASGDLALLCRRGEGRIGPDAPGPDGLPSVLTRLFGAAARPLFSRFHLPEHGAALAEALRLAPERKPAPEPLPAGADALGTVGALLEALPVAGLLRRQTAIRFEPAGGPRRFRPAFAEVALAPEALAGRLTALGDVQSDPTVFRHFAARLDERLVAAAATEVSSGAWTLPEGSALHVNLTLQAVLGSGLSSLVAAARGRNWKLCAEIDMIEAVGEQAAFAEAVARLREAGLAVALDGVSAGALRQLRPALLPIDWLKLEWTPALAKEAGLGRAALVTALAGCAGRVVLTRAETEAAITFGLRHGITVFQGRHVEAVLAAERLRACPLAPGCPLSACLSRAAALSPVERRGCGNPTLLDRALPDAAARAGASR